MHAEAAAENARGALLECRGIDVCVGSRTLVRGLDLQVRRGSMLAVLGPNGSGKSLSLHTFAGLRPPRMGEVLISGRPLAQWPRRALARELALLPQNVEDPFPASVIETVLLGRHPHIARWQWESARDLAIASDALAAVGLAGYEERDVLTLSGGERRRAALAAVLAQTPRLFLLDEPTNQLDPNHQLEALQLLRERADARRGRHRHAARSESRGAICRRRPADRQGRRLALRQRRGYSHPAASVGAVRHALRGRADRRHGGCSSKLSGGLEASSSTPPGPGHAGVRWSRAPRWIAG